jgi:Holliday junction resolvasome RuvABC endonuclease subunit
MKKIMSRKYIIGIDYSMSSPSICIHDGNEWSLNNCKFYFLTSKKKCTIKTEMFDGDYQSDFTSQESRFSQLADWVISKIPANSNIFIEGYAYASKGVVFHIGENTGVLKHKLWKNNITFKEVSPPTVKKFATGKGNSNKTIMYEKFVEETQLDISSIIHCNEGDSPMSDIIDSYYIAKFGFNYNPNK